MAAKPEASSLTGVGWTVALGRAHGSVRAGSIQGQPVREDLRDSALGPDWHGTKFNSTMLELPRWFGVGSKIGVKLGTPIQADS